MRRTRGTDPDEERDAEDESGRAAVGRDDVSLQGVGDVAHLYEGARGGREGEAGRRRREDGREPVSCCTSSSSHGSGMRRTRWLMMVAMKMATPSIMKPMSCAVRERQSVRGRSRGRKGTCGVEDECRGRACVGSLRQLSLDVLDRRRRRRGTHRGPRCSWAARA